MDCVRKLESLEATKNKPVYVSKSDNLSKALTIMQINKFSQLPVISGGIRSVVGVITWTSVGIAMANGVNSNVVQDYMDKDFARLSLDSPLLQALDVVLKYEFAIVFNEAKEMCSIVTTADLSEEYIKLTKPFILIEQIEKDLRVLMEGKFTADEIQKACLDERTVSKVSDLTFGEYLGLIGQPDNWNKLGLNSIDRQYFLSTLDKVRDARNAIMHFRPTGLTNEQYTAISNMADFLQRQTEFISVHE